MSMFRSVFLALLLLASLIAAPTPAHAAQSYDNCTGFIDSVPATITTQGVWCLRKDLSTAITSGNAIDVATNNVTIDCNDFKLGGLGAGDSSQARGIRAYLRQNITIRHCNIRGFYHGILLSGGAGHLVEDNRLDNNLYYGINVLATDNSLVQRNRVFDTGGYPNYSSSYGIYADADVVDNIVSGVFATSANTSPVGIQAAANESMVRGNLVRGISRKGTGTAFGIYSSGYHTSIEGNRVLATYLTSPGYGINGVSHVFCSGNIVDNFATAFYGCDVVSGNLSLP